MDLNEFCATYGVAPVPSNPMRLEEPYRTGYILLNDVIKTGSKVKIKQFKVLLRASIETGRRIVPIVDYDGCLCGSRADALGYKLES